MAIASNSHDNVSHAASPQAVVVGDPPKEPLASNDPAKETTPPGRGWRAALEIAAIVCLIALTVGVVLVFLR